MATIIHKGDFITRVSTCLCVDYEFGWGGNSHYFELGQVVLITTRYDTKYFGMIRGFEQATKEGMQDCLLIENQEGKIQKVGIQDISELEIPE